MSGYLTNLVSRSNERGNILAPRLPSVFESEGFEVEAQSAESSGDIERTQPPVGRSTSTTSRQLFEPENHPQRVQRLELKNVTATSGEMYSPDDLRAFDSPFEPDEPVPVVEKGTKAAPNAPSVPTQVSGHHVETHSVVSSQSQRLRTSPMDRAPAQLQRKAIEQATISNASERGSNHAPVVEVTKEISRTGGDLAREVFDPEADDQRSQPTFRRTSRKVGAKSITSERQLRASLPLDQLREQPIASATRQANEERVADNIEPVINVTIGRIEVKATPASAQEKRESRRSPVMPLDEYLKLQRRGGSR